MKALIDLDNLPQHIAIIMDGNGRWAKKRGASRIFGHQNAVKSVREVTEGCLELGISYLTLYAFSTENWARPQSEVKGLMELLINTLESGVETLMNNNIKLIVIGDIQSLPKHCRDKLHKAIETSQYNTKLTLIIALSYSGRWEIVEATKAITKDILKGRIMPDDVDDELFKRYLQTKDIPDPALMIRTSGEVRISNFLLWQIAYTELFISEVLWPEFRKKDLYEAIFDYQKRERRFGKTSEQLKV